jgi:hypothetical protein
MKINKLNTECIKEKKSNTIPKTQSKSTHRDGKPDESDTCRNIFASIIPRHCAIQT